MTTTRQEVYDKPANNAEAEHATLKPTGGRRWRQLRLDGLLILVTVIWGSTFLITQSAVRVTGPFTYLALSFAVGALSLSIVFHRHLRRLTRAELLSGMFIGVFVFAGYALQTVGLQYTTSSKAGFITGMYVPLVPIFSLFILRQRPTRGAIIGIALSVLGLALLSLTNQFNFQFGLGETLELCCAFAFALQIVCISKFVRAADAMNLTIIQLALTSLLSFIAMPLAREAVVMPPPGVWAAILFVGVADLAFCIGMMNRAQQYMTGNRATLIYALEPAWAALFGYLAGQHLSTPALVGCAFIFLGMITGVTRFSTVRAFFSRVGVRPRYQDKKELS